jgi:hypothetical protein
MLRRVLVYVLIGFLVVLAVLAVVAVFGPYEKTILR